MINIKVAEEIEIMAEGGKILAKIMKELEKQVRPGITTKELDKVAEDLILKSGGKCSFKGYQGFPTCLCASINEEIVHAVPSERKLKEGDIISLDLGILYKGFHTDMAVTLPVRIVNPEVQRLIDVTKKALEIGIEKLKPGNYIGDISKAIQKYVEREGFNVVRELCGHGIGRKLHEAPQILNSVSFDEVTVDKVKYQEDAKIKLKEGMVLCLEPMVTVGDWRIKKSKDGFGYETKDGSLSCHFEHTIAVTENGAKILTVI
ncbi:MAG: type I methionyl aminopeptidase [Candidatus Nealsonbacteria bacterium CG18_big_fil_WC_8_21_14_2_50_37_10]|uniref:Methionine aminopeptidase n=1 Tax=Candidatus Nealsonbacteria bacterium CG18_big_fil_WC_8_21_14_2_50_37_10 TaxID=1974717 RepID=A0A2H0FN85_9BACT|nr:MAG: type I methionyl aminopeptidase [Candidatus Nealsonbacteria bacterium CG18_big_fil_WC_8_21_14_2_50_37_10]